jgi:hypothetical protein
MKSISNPIRSIGDKNRQRVLAILGQLARVLPDWRAAKDLNARLEHLETVQTDASSRRTAAVAQLEATNAAITSLTAQKRGQNRVFLVIVVACLLLMFFKKIAILPGIIAASIWIWRLNTTNREIKRSTESRTIAERTLAIVSDELAGVEREIAQTRDEIAKRPITLPAIQLSSVAFPVDLVDVMGSACALDRSGATALSNLVGVDLGELGTALDPIASALSRVSHVPILLKPTSTDEDTPPLNRLFGEEDEFHSLVSAYTNALGKAKDVTLSLPLLHRSSSIATSLQTRASEKNVVAAESVIVKAHSAEQASIDDFLNEITRISDHGQKTLASLNRTYEALSNTGALYSNARTSSVNHLHLSLFDVLNRASWCSKRFYCPRGIQSPHYIQDLIGIQVAQAHLLSLEEIVARARQDPAIDARMKAKPELLDQIIAAALSVQEFAPSEPSSESDGNQQLRSAYLEDQYQEAIKQFQHCLRKILFGSPHPLLAISSESRLFYDPEMEEWKSDVVPYVYSTSQVQKYGQILKIREELLFPIWDHLWTEKADFRKSELFRTNESLIRMNEKESEKLIEIGNQFRADVRSARHNVLALASEIKSQSLEIEHFGEGISALGLLSERQRNALAIHSTAAGEEHADLIVEAERKETLLAGEPQAQAMRRGALSDPINESKTPQILLEYSDSRSHRIVQPGGP